MRGLSKFIKVIHLAGDIVLLNLAFILAYVLKFGQSFTNIFSEHYVFLNVIYNCIWIALVGIMHTYQINRTTRIELILMNTLKTIALHFTLLLTFIFTINGFYFSRKHLLYTFVIGGLMVLIWRFLAVYIIKVFRSVGGNFKQVVIVGAGGAGNQIYNYLINDPSSGYKLIGMFDDEPHTSVHKDLVKGAIADVPIFGKTNKIDEIFCALPLTASKKIRELMSFADNNLIRFRIVPDFRGFMNKKVNIEFFDQVPVLTVRSEPLENLLNRFFKRTFDIVFSLLVVLILFPILFPLFAILIKLSSKGPVFFVQKRSGRRNEVFSCYKFRTMAVNDKADELQATKEDTRITKIGRFLRKSNLDELPQFFNVLIGNMSVIGPRPHMLKHTEEYSMLIDKFMVRHLVKPGITGWAQVNGFRGTTLNPKYMIKRVRYDMWYIENWSMMLDLKIMVVTIYNMVKGDKNAF